jgi:hypothetical protein|tara:strand:+ start:1342 stop:1980 length:639 start_codon:yes stop_codon:yes gene_type:complete
MAEKCLIEQTKRQRVNGTGPKRNKLVVFKKLGEVSDELYNYLNSYLDSNDQSDIGTDNYGISKGCDYENVFNVANKYRQVILQKNPTNEVNVTDEYLYSHWIDNTPSKELSTWFKNVYRFRLSEMQPNHSLNWHIDADTSVICRAQICLNENSSKFLFKDREGVKSFEMKPKELWFINTGWMHTVENDSRIRRVAIFGFHFDDLKLSKGIML